MARSRSLGASPSRRFAFAAAMALCFAPVPGYSQGGEGVTFTLKLNYSPIYATVGETVNLTANWERFVPPNAYYVFNCGNSKTALPETSQPSASCTYSSAGQFLASVQVTAGSGRFLDRRVVVVHQVLPTLFLEVTPNPPIVGQPVSFKISSSAPLSDPKLSVSWDDPPGSAPLSDTPDQLSRPPYSVPGLHTVEVSGTSLIDDQQRLLNPAQLSFQVLEPPQTTPHTPQQTTPPPPLSLTLQLTSEDPPLAGRAVTVCANLQPLHNDGAYSFSWGRDKQPQSGKGIQTNCQTHTFLTPGTYEVTVHAKVKDHKEPVVGSLTLTISPAPTPTWPWWLAGAAVVLGLYGLTRLWPIHLAGPVTAKGFPGTVKVRAVFDQPTLPSLALRLEPHAAPLESAFEVLEDHPDGGESHAP